MLSSNEATGHHRDETGNEVSQPPPSEHPTQRPEPLILDRAECESLLEQHHVGRLGFVVDGWPSVLPVNYVFDGGSIMLRTDAGTKLSVLRHGAKASLQIDAFDSLYRSGWSVLVFGHAHEITDVNELVRAEALPLRSWAAGRKEFWIRIEPAQITGRRLPKAWSYPDPVTED